MCDRLHACLLRLFPAAFRERYGEEAFQLFHERLADEAGFLKRLRLCVNLLVDVLRALPLAYRNSYAQGAPAEEATADAEHQLALQLLPHESISQANLILACILSLVALAVFTYLLQGPIALHPVAQNGRVSPIQSVMKKLNNPLMADAGPYDFPSTAPTRSGSPLVQMAPSDRADAQSEEARAAIVVRHPGAPPSVPSQPAALPSRLGYVLVELAACPAAARTRMTGTWMPSAVSKDAGLPRRFLIVQASHGSSNPVETHAKQSAQVALAAAQGSYLSFETTGERSKYTYQLTARDGELRGIVVARIGNDVKRSTIVLERVR